MLVRRGVKEINLIAQDTTAYGTDIYDRRSLPRLLKALCRIEGPGMDTHSLHTSDSYRR